MERGGRRRDIFRTLIFASCEKWFISLSRFIPLSHVCISRLRVRNAFDVIYLIGEGKKNRNEIGGKCNRYDYEARLIFSLGAPRRREGKRERAGFRFPCGVARPDETRWRLKQNGEGKNKKGEQKRQKYQKYARSRVGRVGEFPVRWTFFSRMNDKSRNICTACAASTPANLSNNKVRAQAIVRV